MKSSNLLLIIVLAVSFNSHADFSGVVSRVVDGDTIDVLTEKTCDISSYIAAGGAKCLNGKEQIRIRLAEIDAPESSQPYGQSSKALLADLVLDKNVVIKGSSKERHKRALGHIYVDGQWVNAILVKAGAAWVYRQYSKSPGLIEYETTARNTKRGLWALPESEQIEPWLYRRKHR